jgi:hypothetical protein
MFVKWQTTQSRRLSILKQSEEYCAEQVISFQQQTNMEKVFDEVVYPEELTLNKMDHVADTVSDKTAYRYSTGHQTFQPERRLRRAYLSRTGI